MKNPIQTIKSIIYKSTKSEKQLINPSEKIDMGNNSANSFEHKMIEPSIEERLREKRKEWLGQVKELIDLIRLDYMPKYYQGKKIVCELDGIIYKDEFSQEAYKAPSLKIEVNNETFELARSRTGMFQRDLYYSISRTSSYNGRYVNFQRGENCWLYTNLIMTKNGDN